MDCDLGPSQDIAEVRFIPKHISLDLHRRQLHVACCIKTRIISWIEITSARMAPAIASLMEREEEEKEEATKVSQTAAVMILAL